MEALVVSLFAGQYHGRRVLVTGHTGFKGSWLALWLSELGADVTGIALSPHTDPNHWDLLALDMAEHRIDIRDGDAVYGVLTHVQPEIVFHLAAQALVRRSYRDPLETWSTNVIGTANVLEACRQTPSVRAVVVVTSDKCYENRESLRAYRETDRLGGHDAYSASKAAAELVASSYRDAFFDSPDAPLVASARAGNVIGGGDWSDDRLIPDLVRAIVAESPLEVRSPDATRPWQHVLECLSGYLLLGQRLLEGQGEYAEGWNFGPEPEGNRTVTDVLTLLSGHWPGVAWEATAAPQPHETNLLSLDNTKAQLRLHWHPTWSLETTVAATAAWYRAFLDTGEVESRAQLADYVAAAHAADLAWACA